MTSSAADGDTTLPYECAIRNIAAFSSGPPMDPSLRVTVNFHPDRWAGDRLTLEAIEADGVYYSQFVTGTSGCGLTAHPGGDRWRWESRMFAGTYDDTPATPGPSTVP